MCMNCFSRVDMLAVNGAAVAAAASSGWSRLRHRWAGRTAEERRLAIEAQAQDFIRSLDLDPDAVLGPGRGAEDRPRTPARA